MDDFQGDHPMNQPKARRDHVAKMPCPRCGAQPDSLCVGAHGSRQAFHVERWDATRRLLSASIRQRDAESMLAVQLSTPTSAA